MWRAEYFGQVEGSVAMRTVKVFRTDIMYTIPGFCSKNEAGEGNLDKEPMIKFLKSG